MKMGLLTGWKESEGNKEQHLTIRKQAKFLGKKVKTQRKATFLFFFLEFQSLIRKN